MLASKNEVNLADWADEAAGATSVAAALFSAD